jgi:fatty-acid desaturase
MLLGLGNTVGYHRLLTHKSFKTSPFVQACLVLPGALHSGSPLFWVGLHRLHHTKSDSEEDPHSPIHGFWWAHTGWLVGSHSRAVAIALALSGFGQQLIIARHDLLRILGRNPPEWLQICADLRNDPLLRLLDIPGVMPLVFAAQVCLSFWLGGVTGLILLWAVHFWVTNLSWSVNSVCHSERFGVQRFDTGEGSRDVAFLALITAGESYHNGHHRNPRSARHAPEGGVDPSWWLIRGLVALRLASEPRLPGVRRGQGRKPPG